MGGQASINVDTTLIEELADSLEDLSEEFADVTKHADEINADIGSSKVRDAIDEFAENWKIHRGRMIESIDAVSQMANDAHKAFSDVDLELANELLEEK